MKIRLKYCEFLGFKNDLESVNILYPHNMAVAVNGVALNIVTHPVDAALSLIYLYRRYDWLHLCQCLYMYVC